MMQDGEMEYGGDQGNHQNYQHILAQNVLHMHVILQSMYMELIVYVPVVNILIFQKFDKAMLYI